MVTQELTMYEMDKGIKLQENGQWNCPLIGGKKITHDFLTSGY
jgi:hypothetical protein